MSAMRASFIVVGGTRRESSTTARRRRSTTRTSDNAGQTVLANAFVRRLHEDFRCDVDMHRIE
jgi:hypothetical protein